MVFPVVTYGCESWTIKEAEHRRIDAFELCWWRRLLRVPWTVWRSNQSILKESSPEYSYFWSFFGWKIVDKDVSPKKQHSDKSFFKNKYCSISLLKYLWGKVLAE